MGVSFRIANIDKSRCKNCYCEKVQHIDGKYCPVVIEVKGKRVDLKYEPFA